ncbi:hypothetical protein ACFL26_01165 [Patescibacteria group bacterium]
MVIREPRITDEGEWTRISAPVEFGSSRKPVTAWFEIRRQDGIALSDRADAFLASLLPMAMRLGEDVEVEGTVSPRLLENTGEYQRLLCGWFPEYRTVEVRCRRVVSPPAPRDAVMSAFSGGVDSCYTLATSLPGAVADPKDAVTHALFVHGFDIPLAERESYDRMAERYSAMLDGLGVRLVEIRTNVKEIITAHRVLWDQAYGPPLIAAALALDAPFRRFLVPSSCAEGYWSPCGSIPETDPLFSTEATEVIHHSYDKQRDDKLASVAEWEPAFDNLRVCWERPSGGKLNCGRCEKCLRTMMGLDFQGALGKFTALPTEYPRHALRNNLYLHPHFRKRLRATREKALRAGKTELAADISHALLMSWAPAHVAEFFRRRAWGRTLMSSQAMSELYFWLGKKLRG